MLTSCNFYALQSLIILHVINIKLSFNDLFINKIWGISEVSFLIKHLYFLWVFWGS